MLKQTIRLISRIPAISTLVRFSLKIGWACSRIWSHLRFRALVPKAGDSVCHWSVEIKYPENLNVGDIVSIGPLCSIGARSPITLGDYVRISRGVVIETAGLDRETELPFHHLSKPIVIEKGAWIGTHAIILGGVTIGQNAIIGAGTVITKDVPAGAIVVGASSRYLEAK